jgi:periplasmic protein CpxP/Spy
MGMNLLNGLFMSLALLLPCLAGAQMPPGTLHPPGPDLGKWWKNSEIVRELGLSDAQINQIEQTFLEQRLKLIDLRAELEKQEARLQPLIEADQPDETKVSAQIDQVLAARGRLEKANAMMMLAIRRVLSVEQWKKLQTIQHGREQMHQRMIGPPFAPPAPPGGPPVPLPPRPPGNESL